MVFSRKKYRTRLMLPHGEIRRLQQIRAHRGWYFKVSWALFCGLLIFDDFFAIFSQKTLKKARFSLLFEAFFDYADPKSTKVSKNARTMSKPVGFGARIIREGFEDVIGGQKHGPWCIVYLVLIVLRFLPYFAPIWITVCPTAGVPSGG